MLIASTAMLCAMPNSVSTIFSPPFRLRALNRGQTPGLFAASRNLCAIGVIPDTRKSPLQPNTVPVRSPSMSHSLAWYSISTAEYCSKSSNSRISSKLLNTNCPLSGQSRIAMRISRMQSGLSSISVSLPSYVCIVPPSKITPEIAKSREKLAFLLR